MAVFIFFLLLTNLLKAVSADDYYVAAPGTFRLHSSETIGVVFDGVKDVVARIFIQEYPGKNRTLIEKYLLIEPGVPKITRVRLRAADFPEKFLIQPGSPKLVSLNIQIEDFRKEAFVPISTETGYVFVQTDKPIYTPRQGVNIRIIPLTDETTLSSTDLKLQIKNPYGIVVEEKTFKRSRQARPTFENHIYLFPDYAILGTWMATVLYGYKMQQNSSTSFNLDEYVLPTFSVRLKPQEIILPSCEEIKVEVEAKYVYGKKLNGWVTFRIGVGVTDEGGSGYVRANFFHVTSPRKVVDGSYTLFLNTSVLKESEEVGWFPKLENSRLLVEATVFDEVSGKEETTSNFNGIFTFSAFAISFKRSFKDFKPGLTTVFEADINYVGGRPASGISVEICVEADGKPMYIEKDVAISDLNGKVSFEMHPESQHEALNIMLRTTDPRYTGSQAERSFQQLKYRSNSSAYVAFDRTLIPGLRAGDNFTKMIHLEPPTMQDVYYMIVSKGKIIAFKKVPVGNKVEFQVTFNMVPGFRIIAFAHHNDELLADSLTIEVERICYGNSKVIVTPDFEVKEPGRTGKFIIEAGEKSLVGLFNVDEALYVLYKKDILTKDKVFNEIANKDLGCGPGGGMSTSSVLDKAGIALVTNHFTPPLPHACAETRRRKRETLQMKEEVSNDSRKDKGNFREVKRRQRSISEAEVEVIEQNITVRNDFWETWHFQDIQIDRADGTEIPSRLPSSITTWMIQAVTVSFEHGICVSEPQRIESMKEVFLHLDIPTSAAVNEQAEVHAVVFNYGQKNLSAYVYMYDTNDLCTEALPGLKTERQTLIIEPYSGKSSSFPVLPLTASDYDIKMLMVTSEGSDAVQKQLHVAPEGVRKEFDIQFRLDPTNRRQRTRDAIQTHYYSEFFVREQNLQVIRIKLRAPSDTIPGTARFTIEATGDRYGHIAETIVSNPETLLERPRGNGEQNIMYLASTLYTMKYLKATDRLTTANEEKGYEYIRLGYTNQLSFRQEDGSYSAYEHIPSSAWLTAFVMKVFCQAQNFVHISSTVVCSGLKWIVKYQRRDGSFTEVYRMIELDMMGGVQSDTSMTAFVFIALAECSCEDEIVKSAKKRALSYLEDNMNKLNSSVEVAMVAYALSLGGSDQKSEANDRLISFAVKDKDKNMLHWEKENNYLTIEAAGYALLNQLLLDDMETSASIVNWLNTKTLQSGLFEATQDLVITLQALSEYATKTQMQTINLVSNIFSISSPFFHQVFFINESNAHVLQERMVDRVNDTLLINTMGQGVGRMNIKMHYYAFKIDTSCGFDIQVYIMDPVGEKMYCENNSKIRLSLRIRYTIWGDALDSVVDVEIFPGFVPVIEDLNKLVSDPATLVDRYEVSSRGVVFYLRKIPGDVAHTLEFHVVRKYDTGAIFSHSVRVYERYNPGSVCIVFYSPGGKNNMVHRSCDKTRCTCAGGSCPPVDTVMFDIMSKFMAVEDGKNKLRSWFCNNYDYMWTGILVEYVELERGIFNLTVSIKEVIREGLEKRTDVVGMNRFFLMRTCKFDFKLKNSYLILSKDKPMYSNDQRRMGYRYLLGADSIFMWRAAFSRLMRQCLREVIELISETGCPS